MANGSTHRMPARGLQAAAWFSPSVRPRGRPEGGHLIDHFACTWDAKRRVHVKCSA